MKHSPAPWKWDKHIGDDSYPELAASNGDCIMHFGGGCAEEGDWESGQMPINPHDLSVIAAAPDLLEACKLAIASDDDMRKMDYYYRMPDEIREQIEAAIAKAEPPDKP